jgi:integrase
MCSIKFIIDNRSKLEHKPILIRINHDGKTTRRSTGIKLTEDEWDNSAGFPKDKTSEEFKELASLEKIILNEIYPTIKELLERRPTMEEFKEAYDAHFNSTQVKTDSFRITDLIQAFIDSKKGIYSDSAIRHYERLKELVMDKFGGSIYDNINSLDKTWALKFIDYLVSDEDLQYQNSTITVFLKKLISVLNFHDKQVPFRIADVMRGFKKSSDVNDDKPYICFSEIDCIDNFVAANYSSLDDEYKVIDLFVWCCHTGMRYNEAITVTCSMIKDSILTYTTSKNNKRISVPLSRRCMDIVESKMRGRLFEDISNSKANTVLTKILRDYGMNDSKTVVRFSGKNKEVKEKSLADLISFHSSRRSYISNLLDNAVPIKDVALLTGISMSTLINYYASSNQEEVNSRVLEILNR